MMTAISSLQCKKIPTSSICCSIKKNGVIRPLDKSQLTAIDSKEISTYSTITFAKTLFIPNSCFVDNTGCVSNFFRKLLTTLAKQINIFFISAMRQVDWDSLRVRKWLQLSEWWHTGAVQTCWMNILKWVSRFLGLFCGIRTEIFCALGESTSLECLKQFCLAIIAMYKDQYLRSPTAQDTKRLLKVAEARGFPGMMGLLDCMHWSWKNFPTP